MNTYLTIGSNQAPGQTTVESLIADVERLLAKLPTANRPTAENEYLYALTARTEGGKRLALQSWLMRWLETLSK